MLESLDVSAVARSGYSSSQKNGTRSSVYKETSVFNSIVINNKCFCCFCIEQ